MLVSELMLQLSVGVGTVQLTFAPQRFSPLPTLMFAGQVTEGNCVSLMVTVKLQFAVCRLPAVTTKVLVVVPTGKVAPLARPAVCAVLAPEQLSAPTGVEQVMAAPQIFRVLACVTFAGQVMVGACASVTVTVKLQAVVCKLPAVTVNVFVVTPTGKAAPLARPAVWAVDAPEQLSVPTGAV